MSITRRRALGTALVGFPAILKAQAARRPNFLFFFPDQWRYDWTPFRKGLALRMPHLERMASRGKRFTRAVVASPVCAPSRACLAAGVEYERCQVPSNGYDYPLSQTTYYRRLRDSGYHVLGCGKLDLHKKTKDWGRDGRRLVKEWGFTDAIDSAGKGDAISSTLQNGRPMDPFMAHLERRGLLQAHLNDFDKRKGRDSYWNTDPCPLPDADYGDTWVASNGIELLQAVPQGTPWHLVVNFPGPHNPMDITKSMYQSVQGRSFAPPVQSHEGDAAGHAAIRQNYTAMCENIDTQMGRLLAAVERRGELENTVVVFSSDHGEMLGDHDRWAKSVPYQPSVGVPLVVSGPGVESGTTDALVSHIDLAATFLDFAGLLVPETMDARSLRGLLSGRVRTHRDVAHSALGNWRMSWDGRFKLVQGFRLREGEVRGAGPDTAELLFDLLEDPGESANVISRHREVADRLRLTRNPV
jgi:arylsulfatase A-like enzyme